VLLEMPERKNGGVRHKTARRNTKKSLRMRQLSRMPKAYFKSMVARSIAPFGTRTQSRKYKSAKARGKLMGNKFRKAAVSHKHAQHRNSMREINKLMGSLGMGKHNNSM
jgi:hypothetical protein